MPRRKSPAEKSTLKSRDCRVRIRVVKISDMVFTGFNRRVAALHRLTGQIVWQWKAPKGSSYVSLLLEQDLLVVSVDGYMYGLDPLTGGQLWYNSMDGFGSGVTSLVSVNGAASNSVSIAAAQIAARQAAESSAHNTAGH